MDEHEFDALLLRPFAREDFQRGRKLEWDAAERSPPRFSAERPRSCVNWRFSSASPFGLCLGGFPGPGTARSDDFRLGFKRFERPAHGLAVSMAEAVRVGHHHG
jgi:hypothetical protein